jgi:hypothetical protein
LQIFRDELLAVASCIMMRNELLILTFLWIFPLRSSCSSWNIFSLSTASERALMVGLDGVVADFTVDSANDPRRVKLLENAQNRVTGPKNCWHEAYRMLFTSCGDIMADKELAWHLSSCFQEDSGRPFLPSCSKASKMVNSLPRDELQSVFITAR